MITTFVPTITIHDDAEGAMIQSVKLSLKSEVSTVLVAHAGTGVAQVGPVTPHTKTMDFTVSGHGDLTFDVGLDQEHGISLITGGVVFVKTFNYEQTVNADSKWDYDGTHYPYGSAAA